MAAIAKLACFLSRFTSLCLATGVTASITATFPNLAQADVVYSGVAVGDATSNSAVIWTRATDTNQPSNITNLTA